MRDFFQIKFQVIIAVRSQVYTRYSECNLKVLLEIVITKFYGKQHTISAKFSKNTCESVYLMNLQLSENLNSFKGIFPILFTTFQEQLFYETLLSSYFLDFTSMIKGTL